MSNDIWVFERESEKAFGNWTERRADVGDVFGRHELLANELLVHEIDDARKTHLVDRRFIERKDGSCEFVEVHG